MLASLAGCNRQQNGFIDRMLFAYPEDLKKEYWNDNSICPSVAYSWETYLSNLLDLPLLLKDDHSPQPQILSYSPEAYQLLCEWQKYNTDQVNDAPIDSLGGIKTKLEVYCIRLSLILQMAAYVTGEDERTYIELPAVIGAIKLMEYFRHTGTRVHDIISPIDPLQNLPINKRLIYEALPSLFTTSEGRKDSRKIWHA